MNVKWTNIVFRCVKHCDEPLWSFVFSRSFHKWRVSSP